MVEDWDIHKFTLTGNWTQVKPPRGGSKQLVSPCNNWAILVIVQQAQNITNYMLWYPILEGHHNHKAL